IYKHIFPTRRSSDLDEEESVNILSTISKSFQHVGIQLASSFLAVDSIEDWTKQHAGKENILPYVLDPELLVAYSPKGKQEKVGQDRKSTRLNSSHVK